jgi:hypothetical protein
MECPNCHANVAWFSPALNLRVGQRKTCPHCGADMMLVIPRRTAHLLALAVALAILVLAMLLPTTSYRAAATIVAIVVMATSAWVALRSMRLEPATA